MRRMKKISLFFYSCALFCAGVYGHIKYLDFFYPGLWYSVPKEVAAESDGGQEAIPVSFAEQVVTSDTRLLVRIRDMDSGSEREEEVRMPEKYVGMNREQFVRLMQEDPQGITLREREAGFEFLEVESFSPECVVLTKGYRQKTVPDFFYLMLEENKVVIFEEDGSVYQRTDIDGRKLSGELRNAVLNGKKQITRAELEKFLVTYAAS